MKAGALVSVEEYLNTSYDPDCDYVEGRLVERNVGELDHSDVQTSLVVYIRNRYPEFWAGVEVRVQVKRDRFRVPDVTIVAGAKPNGSIITEPPLVAAEVLSRDDRVDDTEDRIEDYLAMGIRYVWVLNPRTRRAFIYTADGSREVKDGVLRTADLKIEVPLSSLFG